MKDKVPSSNVGVRAAQLNRRVARVAGKLAGARKTNGVPSLRRDAVIFSRTLDQTAERLRRSRIKPSRPTPNNPSVPGSGTSRVAVHATLPTMAPSKPSM